MRESATSIILFVPQSYTYFYKRSPYIIWFYFGKRPYMVLLLHINTYRIDPRVKHYQIRYTRSKKKKKKSLYFHLYSFPPVSLSLAPISTSPPLIKVKPNTRLPTRIPDKPKQKPKTTASTI